MNAVEGGFQRSDYRGLQGVVHRLFFCQIRVRQREGQLTGPRLRAARGWLRGRPAALNPT